MAQKKTPDRTAGELNDLIERLRKARKRRLKLYLKYGIGEDLEQAKRSEAIMLYLRTRRLH